MNPERIRQLKLTVIMNKHIPLYKCFLVSMFVLKDG